jgi:hypothetical protein
MSDPIVDLTHEQVNTIVGTIATEICVYMLVGGLIFYNSFHFLYRQGNYKNIYLTSFYLIALTVIISRIVNLILLASWFNNGKEEGGVCALSIHRVNTTAVYAKILMGYIQIG